MYSSAALRFFCLRYGSAIGKFIFLAIEQLSLLIAAVQYSQATEQLSRWMVAVQFSN
jgi:hypothetical protein